MGAAVCENCGAERRGRYCAACGQNDRDYRRAFGYVFGEVVRETFEVDSRLVRSLRALFLRPGWLSLEFSRNRRAAYVTPVRLYFVASLLFFFIASMTGTFSAPNRGLSVEGAALANVATSDIEALRELVTEPQREKLDAILARREGSFGRIAILALARDVARDPPSDDVERFIIGQVVDVLHDPEFAFAQMADNLPIAMFFMLPVFALLSKTVFRRQPRVFLEHLVFATHLHTLAFLVFSVLILLPPDGGVGWPGLLAEGARWVLWGFLGWHCFAGMRSYYGTGVIETGIRGGVLLGIYAASLFAALIVVMVATIASL